MDEAAAAQKLLAHAVALRDSGRIEEAGAAFAEFYRRFAGSADPRVRLGVAEAVVNVGVLLMGASQPSAAVSAFDRVIREYAEAAESVAAALYNKGNVLMADGRFEGAAQAFGELIRRFDDFADTWAANSVAGALCKRGIALAKQGQLDQALVALEDVVLRFGGSTDTGVLNHVASALYNRGIVLRDAGRMHEGVAAFTETATRFADSSAPELRRWAAMGLYNRSIDLARIGDAADSVASAEEMVRRFGDSNDPAVRERLAKALYSRALLIRHAGQIKDAVHAFWDIERRFANDQNPVVRAVLAAARRHDLFILASVNRVGHAATNIFQRDTFGHLEQALREAPPERTEDREQDLAFYREVVEKRLERDFAAHERAARILVRYLDEGEPYGLFLRNFDIEGFLRMGTAGGEAVRVSVQGPQEGAVEKYLASALKKISVLGVGNSNLVRPDFKHYLPKLELPYEYWQEVIEELVRAAELIILNIERLTPGVLLELDIVQHLGKQDQAIVVLSEPDALMDALVESLYDVSPSEYPQAQRDSTRLSSFRRVVHEAQLPKLPENSPLFRDLLDHTDEIRRREPVERMRWDGIVF